MAATDPITPEPRRFSIRSLRPLWIAVAIVVLILAVVWLNLGVPIYRRQVAIREIERLHGGVTRMPGTPQWLKSRVGDKCDMVFDEITQVWLSEKHVTDDSLRRLRGLTNLEELWLNKTEVTDEGLTIVEEMPRLKKLWLDDTQITDAGLRQLRGLILQRSVDIA